MNIGLHVYKHFHILAFQVVMPKTGFTVSVLPLPLQASAKPKTLGLALTPNPSPRV